MDTGPRTPKEASSPLNANTCPKLRTSVHSSHAIFAHKSLSAFFFLTISFLSTSQPSARSFKLLKPSSLRSSDCTNIRSPKSCIRFLIFLLIHTSEISPYPSISVLGRFPFNGSPFGLAFFTLINSVKSIFPCNLLIVLFLLNVFFFLFILLEFK